MPTLNLTATDTYTDESSIPNDTLLYVTLGGQQGIEIILASSLPAATMDGAKIIENGSLNINMASGDNFYVRNILPGSVNAQFVVVY